MNNQNQRSYYDALFGPYPDVVTTEQTRQMLGGIGLNTVIQLLQAGHIKSIKYYRTHEYLVPKCWVIDYILSNHYLHFKSLLKTQI